MKKIMISIAALVLAASCVNKVEVKTPEAGSGLKAVTVLGDETKVSYVDGTGFLWQVGEKAGLVAEGQNISSYDLEIQNIGEQQFNEKSEFKGGFQATFWFEAEDGTYTLYHPFNEGSANGAIKFAVNPVQEQEKPGFADTWFASRFPLIGKEDVTLSGEGTKSAETSYKLVGSIVRFFIGGVYQEGGLKYGEYLRSVTIEADKNIAGTIVTDNTGAITSVEGGSASVKVVTNQQLGQDKPGEGTGVYAIVTPVKDAMVKFTVRTSTGTYTFTKATAVTWENGAKYDVVLNLAKAEFAEDKTPERLFAYGDATKAQWNVQDGVELTKQEDGTFKGTFALEQGKEFRFAAHRTNGEYTDNYGKGEGDTDLIQWVSANPSAPNFTVATGTGLYDVTVNFSTMTIALEQKAPYFIGNGTGWKFVQMTEKEGSEGVYFIESQIVTRSGEDGNTFGGDFTFTFNNNWENGRFLAPENQAPFTEGTAGIQIDGYPKNDWKWYEINPTYARMYVELDTKTATVKAWPLFYFIGTAVEAGWIGDWETTFVNRPKFSPSETQNVVTWTGELKEGQLKFRTAEIKGDWYDADQAWANELFLFCDYNDPGEQLLDVTLNADGEFEAKAVGYTNGDHKWKIVTPGNYTVTLTFERGKDTMIKFHKNTVEE